MSRRKIQKKYHDCDHPPSFGKYCHHRDSSLSRLSLYDSPECGAPKLNGKRHSGGRLHIHARGNLLERRGW